MLKQQISNASRIPSRVPAPQHCIVDLRASLRYSSTTAGNQAGSGSQRRTPVLTVPTTGDTVDPGSQIQYWRRVGIWSDVDERLFLSHRWQTRNGIDKRGKLLDFLSSVLPEKIPPAKRDILGQTARIRTRAAFVKDVEDGMQVAPMSVRLTPHVLSVADWTDPINDPIRRQFIPLKSTLLPDHPKAVYDSLHEDDDSPVHGLVHRYPDKALFLATSICPVYCRFCTRSYAVGLDTESVKKASLKPKRSHWETMFDYIEKTPAIQDVVVSGGDSYLLQPDQLQLIGERLLSIPHIKRFRFATKGLAVSPVRILDRADGWTDAFVDLSNKGRALGKQVAMHTHFNHPSEVTWITELAARYLFAQGVIVRNQTVLLRGVNDDVRTMSTLIRKLADLNITPYYVYQSDMVKGIEDLRTPLSTIIELEKQIRGSIAGFMMPSFVVDVPGGGGKRLANSFESYDPKTGVSTWKAPGVAGDQTFEYHDPIRA
ncbi:hypothetical protein LTR62_003105 [Meristemomyces frigidus]|uniref:L-lysine 2,3-aminomutase n=1 Tax=Meristemomyces frigidus TaxID=1508187 RepID=A0AAN7YKZ3_9PEZI|nr:hypothetical protein LTR62_003105 [Meristemomyces frigidus]